MPKSARFLYFLNSKFVDQILFFNNPEKLKQVRINIEQGSKGIFNPILLRIYEDAHFYIYDQLR